MKNAKFILLIILFFFINSTAFAQSITVDDPHSEDVWYKTKPCTIRWTKSGSMDANVKIRLFNSAGTVRIMNITNSTDNDGEFGWTIPSTVATGNYRIRVKTVDNAVYDDSDEFRIQQQGYTHPGTKPNLVPGYMRLPVGKSSDFFISSMTISPIDPVVFNQVKFTAVIKNTTPVTTKDAKADLVVRHAWDPGRVFAFTIPPIQPNKSYTYTKTYIPYKAGGYVNILTIDKTNVVKNELEANNSSHMAYIVQPLRIYYTPRSVAAILTHKGGDKNFADNGPKVIFSAEIYLSQNGKELSMKYYMRARETKPDWTNATASGIRTLYRLSKGNKGYIQSFAGGFTKVVYQYNFAFGAPGKGSKTMHGTTIPIHSSSVGKGTTNPMKLIFFMGNNPKKKDDIGYCGFEISFNKIEIVLDGLTGK